MQASHCATPLRGFCCLWDYFAGEKVENPFVLAGQLCTIQYLPALQIINMREDLRPGDLVTRLAIIGNTSEIATRLLYNSSEVQTNGTSYFRLNFTDLYLTSSESIIPSFGPTDGGSAFSL